MSSWKTHLRLPMTAALVVVIAGCSSSVASQAPSNAPTPTAAVSNAPAATAEPSAEAGANDLLEKVKTTKSLLIGVGSYPPTSMVDPATGEWHGYDIDMLLEFAKSLGVDPYITYMPASALVPALQAGRIDMWIDLYKNPEREQVLDFSDTWTCYTDGVFVSSSNPKVSEATVNGLTGKRIATDRGSAEEPFIDAVPQAEKVLYETAEQSLLEVASGRVDAAFQPSVYAQYVATQNPNLKVTFLGPVPKELKADGAVATPSFFGVSKGEQSATFLDTLNAYINDWRSSGKMKESFAKYGLTDEFFFSPTCQ